MYFLNALFTLSPADEISLGYGWKKQPPNMKGRNDYIK
jgi:hypothetical protein